MIFSNKPNLSKDVPLPNQLNNRLTVGLVAYRSRLSIDPLDNPYCPPKTKGLVTMTREFLQTTLLLLFFTHSALATQWVPISVGDITIIIPINAFTESDESRATTLGIDADNDGVRDDIQARINHEYANNSYLRTQSLQMAATYQKTLT